MGAGTIISETEPGVENKYTWVKPVSDGLEFYELVENTWVLQYTISYAVVNHTHDGLDSLPDIVTLLNNGVTGQKTVGNYTLTFNHGVLVGFEET